MHAVCGKQARAPAGRGDAKMRLVCVHYQYNPSPLAAECFSEVYSTFSQVVERKDSILQALLTLSRSTALPQALVSELLLSRTTNSGCKMGLEATQHFTSPFSVTRMKNKRRFYEVTSASYGKLWNICKNFHPFFFIFKKSLVLTECCVTFKWVFPTYTWNRQTAQKLWPSNVSRTPLCFTTITAEFTRCSLCL